MQAPKIKTAIPQRRYQYGGFTAVMLGDIDSDDGFTYRYICAMVPDGASQPSMYVMAVKNAPGGEGGYSLRVLTEGFDKVVDSSDRWRDLDMFSKQALDLAQQVLGLSDETPIRLM